MKSFAVLGRQPKIGYAELESLYGSQLVEQFSDQLAFINYELDYRASLRLGSVVKVGLVEFENSFVGWSQLATKIVEIFNKVGLNRQAGKLTIGLSIVGLAVPLKDIEKVGLAAKKTLKKSGRSIRLVPNKQPSLSTAQVLHNKLDGKAGIELVVCVTKDRYFIGSTIYEQDIEAYTARDQARPKRDAFVGMLPPKLAQTIINLASGKIHKNQELSGLNLLDPFCGTGVILQEALLMGYSVIGSDLSLKMVDYSQSNINWLKEKYHRITTSNLTIHEANAAGNNWQQQIDLVATETFLGSPISMMPDQAKLVKLLGETNSLHKKTLQNLAGQLTSGTRLCLAVPTWRIKNGFKHLPTLDQLGEIGYNRIDFKYAKASDLIYIRENQFVGRELVVLEKN